MNQVMDIEAMLALRTRVGDLEAACTAYKGELELTADELGVESPAQIRDAIRQLRTERDAARAACQAALAIHDRYCDRVGASDGWARSVHGKLRAAIEAASGEQAT